MAVHPHSTLSPSALQTHLNTLPQKNPLKTLPHEILHNLCHQHNWTDLSILSPPPETIPYLTLTSRYSSSSSSSSHHRTPTLLTGHPPKPLYTHPTHQSHLLLHPPTSDLPPTPQLEYILPLALSQSFTLRLLQAAFDAIPAREAITGENGFRHQDAKRILLAMRGRQGMGGDGTVNYYIVQEGEVKPRQN